MVVHISLVGGPCTGKTALINALKDKGYPTIDESSREIVKKQKKMNGTLLPWIDRDTFQKEMVKLQIEKRKACKNKKIVFSDTSIPCGIAYYLADNLKIPEEIWKSAKENKYDLVFILDFPTEYENDEVRKETKEKAELIHKHLREIYKKLNCKIIEVPKINIESRVEMIKETIKKEFPNLLNQ